MNGRGRLLCLDQYAELGGGQRSLLDLLPAFRESGWNPMVAAPPGTLTDIAKQHGYGVHLLDIGQYQVVRKTAADMLKYAVAIPRLLATVVPVVRDNRVGVIYANGPRILPIAAAASRLSGVPLVFHCHNRLLQRSAVVLSGKALQMAAAHIIACCRFAAEPLLPYLRPERSRIIFNGVADMASERRTPLSGRGWRIAVIGRIEEQKGQLEFVRAARLVAQRYSECRFLIVGAPFFSGAAYHEQVVTESNGLNFEFCNWTDNVAEVLAQVDLVVVPSKAVEATTRVILEAFSARVPVVAFPSGGIPEILRDGENGFLTNGRDMEALAQRMLEVLATNQQKLMTVRTRARRCWEDNFTLTGYRERVCGLLETVFASALPLSEIATAATFGRSAIE